MARTGIKLAYLYKITAVAVLLSCYSHAINWDIQIVEPNTGEISGADIDIDMVLDINNVAHVTYFDNSDDLTLRYASGSSQWFSVPVEQENLIPTALRAVIAIDSNGAVYIVYPYNDPYYGESLYWRKRENGQWSEPNSYVQGALFLPQDAEIGVSSDLNVLYTRMLSDANSSDTSLIFQMLGGSEEVIAEHGNFQSGSLAIDRLSNPHLCYYDALNDVLRYAVKDGNSWTIETVDENIGDVPSSIWGSACLALDSSDVPHISYIDFANFDLKYADKLSGGWKNRALVGGTTNVGLQTSIAVDSDDKIHICYKRKFQKRAYIKYAVGSVVEGWQIDYAITDFNQLNSAYLSIACSDDNKSHVCYTAPALYTIEYASERFYGDLDENSRVDFFDFSILGKHWLDTGCALPDYCDGADLNESTEVDNNDLDLLGESWLDCSLPDCY